MKKQATKKVSAATEAALKEVKERSKAAAAKKATGPRNNASIPKNQKSATANSHGNTGR
jgi:hypothetical protein